MQSLPALLVPRFLAYHLVGPEALISEKLRFCVMMFISWTYKQLDIWYAKLGTETVQAARICYSIGITQAYVCSAGIRTHVGQLRYLLVEWV